MIRAAVTPTTSFYIQYNMRVRTVYYKKYVIARDEKGEVVKDDVSMRSGHLANYQL